MFFFKTIFQGFKRIWLAIGSVLLILLVLEIFANFLFYVKHRVLKTAKEVTESADGYKGTPWVHELWSEQRSLRANWRPYVYWRTAPFQGKFIQINSDGIRSTFNLPPGKIKPVEIFMFGGSTMLGTDARNDYTIPSCLSRILSRQSKYPVEVTNFGQAGYISTQEMIALFLELQHGHVPDIAVFYDGGNDAYSAANNLKAGVTADEETREREFDLLGKARKKRLLKLFVLSNIYNSGIVELAGRFHLLPHFSSPGGYMDSGRLAQETADIYLSNIKLIQAVSREERFTPLFYWQPLLYTKKHRTPYEKEQLKSWASFPMHGLSIPFFSEVYDGVEQSKYLSSLPNFHDISHIFDDIEAPLYIDGVHITEAGNEMVAERMAADILPLIRKKFQSRQSF